MTLLANAGIYLVLDVNSPRPGEALNRYEPWSTYNTYYLEHVLRIIHQFAGYNNTLGFFAGNEVINDEISARESPHYLKAIVRDMHLYMKKHSPRDIPIGYSAADDLRYRISLAKYLECGDEGAHVDFYGVNSYQWCGYQTFQTSGYDSLVSDYSDYTLPIFLSEYGCNAINPRVFQEVEPLYSLQMTSVFAGGLIYEYAQEANAYGVVDIDREGNAYALEDFDTLQREYVRLDTYYDFSKEKPVDRPLKCKKSYPHLNADNKVPESPVSQTISQGLSAPIGKFIELRVNSTLYKVFDTKKNEITDRRIIKLMDWKTPMAEPKPYKAQSELVNLPPKNAKAASGAGKPLSEYPTSQKKDAKGQIPERAKTKTPRMPLRAKDKEAITSSSSVLGFDEFSMKLLFWSFIIGGPLAGAVWMGGLL